MRLLSRLLVVLIVCLVATALPATPAQAQGAVIVLSPDSGAPGEEVTVYGYNFTPGKWVDIYYYRTSTGKTWMAEVKTVSSGTTAGRFTVIFIVPESYMGEHTVRAEEDSTSAYVAQEVFTVEPILLVDPEEGPVGTNVTVEGHGFAEDEHGIELRYYVDDTSDIVAQNIEADEYGYWETSFRIPPSSRGSHKIDAMGDTTTFREVRDVTFEVTPGITLGKTSGSVGENITTTGSGFAADERDITILFDGEAVATEIRADGAGYWQESFQVPEMPTGNYSVTAEGELTSEEDISAVSFKIVPGLVLSPDKGHVGTDLTVTGGGFAVNEDVVVRYDGSQKATAPTDSRGSFEASFIVPESEHGGRQVTAEDSAANEANAIFTMESVPPPMPTLTSPASENSVGFIGRVRPTFAWSAVSDDSGVSYSLQIAASANVAGSGEFVDPIISVEGIVGTSYTLGKTEALPHGTYYWTVQAVDGADNESAWTAARSFHAGVMPIWAFVLIIVAIVAGIGAGVYFFVMRRRIHYL